MSNIIIADFSESADIKTEAMYQYDFGQILKIEGVTLPNSYEVHFCNRLTGGALVMIGGPDGVEIPDELFTTGLEIYAWTFVMDGEDSGKTILKATIPIIKRAMPTEEQPTPHQQSVINQLIGLMEESVDEVETLAAQAEANVSHYPTIINGEWAVWDASTEAWVSTGVDAHGNGIASVSVDPLTYEMTITFDDGSTYVTDSLRGPQGPTGPAGPQGETGATGAQGPQGETGPVAAFSIGNTSTLPAGSAATASITGTAAAPVLNLGIPKGDTGATGPQGPAYTPTITNISDWNTDVPNQPAVAFIFQNGTASNSPGGTGTNYIVGFQMRPTTGFASQIAWHLNIANNDVFVRHYRQSTGWASWNKVTVS